MPSAYTFGLKMSSLVAGPTSVEPLEQHVRAQPLELLQGLRLASDTSDLTREVEDGLSRHLRHEVLLADEGEDIPVVVLVDHRAQTEERASLLVGQGSAAWDGRAIERVVRRDGIRLEAQHALDGVADEVEDEMRAVFLEERDGAVRACRIDEPHVALAHLVDRVVLAREARVGRVQRDVNANELLVELQVVTMRDHQASRRHPPQPREAHELRVEVLADHLEHVRHLTTVLGDTVRTLVIDEEVVVEIAG